MVVILVNIFNQLYNRFMVAAFYLSLFTNFVKTYVELKFTHFNVLLPNWLVLH